MVSDYAEIHELIEKLRAVSISMFVRNLCPVQSSALTFGNVREKYTISYPIVTLHVLCCVCLVVNLICDVHMLTVCCWCRHAGACVIGRRVGRDRPVVNQPFGLDVVVIVLSDFAGALYAVL